MSWSLSLVWSGAQELTPTTEAYYFNLRASLMESLSDYKYFSDLAHLRGFSSGSEFVATAVHFVLFVVSAFPALYTVAILCGLCEKRGQSHLNRRYFSYLARLRGFHHDFPALLLALLASR